MTDKFTTQNFEIDLQNLNLSFTEENPRFKDSFWTKYTMPITVPFSSAFFANMGHYGSLYSANLERYHKGTHVFEGRAMDAKLEVLEIGQHDMKVQIDSGFENLPNFEKKLAELPLLQKDVPDIYDHANTIVPLKYPATDYNFPKIYTDEYDLANEAYFAFDGFINNRRPNTNGVKIFPKNEIRDGTDVVNRNIMHPMPYLLYLLKKGFEDAGFELSGDVLNDAALLHRCIYNNKQYHNTGEQKAYVVNFFNSNFDENFGIVPYDSGRYSVARYNKYFRFTAPGRYRVLNKNLYQNLAKNEMTINYNQELSFLGHIVVTEVVANQNLIIDIKESAFNNKPYIEVRLEFAMQVMPEYINPQTYKNEGVARMDINPIRIHTKEGTAIPYILNFNRVDLKLAVPDISFGELVNTIKNWRNYDIVFDGNKAYMNYIKLDDQQTSLDFRDFEIDRPSRTFTDKQKFQIKFPKVEDADVQSVIYDDKNYTLTDADADAGNASVINVNGFCLPIVGFRGVQTAKAYKENSLQLVYYAGLDTNGDNHATNPKGLHNKQIAEFLLPWYKGRLTNMSYRWSFICKKSALRNVNIRSKIYCYGREHWIKSWAKNSISPELYSVDFETESINPG